MSAGLSARWLGRVPYLEALGRQRAHREAVIRGEAPEVLWMLEHPPVVTTGRRAVPDLPPDLDVVRTERGGLATFHGPGQLVGYLIADVSGRGWTVRGTVCALEAGVISWLGTRQVSAGRRDGYPGVWVGKEKICALGLHFRQGVSMHGIALNLTVDLTGFDRFTPCGIADGGVTSLARLGAREGLSAPTPEQAWEGVSQHLLAALTGGG